MNEKQTNYLFIAYLLLIIFGSIYAANKKPIVPAEIVELLESAKLTDSDMRFGVCFITLRGNPPSGDSNKIREYCNQFR